MRWLALIVLVSGRIAYAGDPCGEAQRALAAEQWSAAEILLDQCAAAGAPPWLGEARENLAGKLTNFAPIMIAGVPLTGEITVSTIPGLRFAPRTFHLPTGTHVVTATAPDHARKQLTVRVVDQMPQRLFFDMPSTLPPPPPPPPSSYGPWLVIGAGAALVLTGVAYHVLELEPEREALADASDPAHDPSTEEYAKHSSAFDSRRRITIGIYAAGVAALLGGAIWRYFDYKSTHPEITATSTSGGATVGLQWRL